MDGNHSNNAADNLIALCPNHHVSAHGGRFGKKLKEAGAPVQA